MVKVNCLASSTTTQSNNSHSEKELFLELRKKGVYRVGPKETLTSIAKKFGVDNYKTLMKFIGREEGKTSLSYGEELKGFKTIKCKSGQGLSSLAKSAGMKLDDFCALNKIDKNYTPQPDELFFIAFNEKEIEAVKGNKTTPQPISTTPKEESSQSTDRENGQYKVKKGDTLYAIADKFNMNVNDFKTLTGLSSSNIKEGQIIKNVPTLTVKAGKGWSWILENSNGMTISEIKSLNNLPANYQPKANEKLYIFGSEAISPNSPNKNGNARVQDSKNRTYKVPSVGYITAKAGEKVAKNGLKPDIPIDANGNVVAEVIKFIPTNEGEGSLSGHTIMVNAGHGWGANKVFDPGTHAEDSNGKTIYEWYKNRNFADELITELTNQGATVIYTGGKAKQVCDAKAKFKHDILISIHCNSAANKNSEGLQIYYYDSKDKNLANLIDSKFEKHDNCTVKPDNQTQHSGLGILRRSAESASVLLEMGFQSNSDDLKNIDSKKFRQETMRDVTTAIIEYLK